MNEDHGTKARPRPSKRKVKQIDPERLRKAIQYLRDHPAPDVPDKSPYKALGRLP